MALKVSQSPALWATRASSAAAASRRRSTAAGGEPFCAQARQIFSTRVRSGKSMAAESRSGDDSTRRSRQTKVRSRPSRSAVARVWEVSAPVAAMADSRASRASWSTAKMASGVPWSVSVMVLWARVAGSVASNLLGRMGAGHLRSEVAAPEISPGTGTRGRGPP